MGPATDRTDRGADPSVVQPGRLADHPCVRFPGGPRPLVVLPGINDLFQPIPPGRIAGRILADGFLGPYRDEWTPWLVGRPRGFEATTTRGLAAGYADALGAFGRPVDVPTLVVGGERDPFFPPDRVREAVAGLPDARRLVFPDANHGLHEERTARFDGVVRSFLRK